MKKVLLSSILLAISGFNCYSQTGPAGIGTGDGSSGPRNVLWLRSDLGVTQSGTVSAWADQSGNGLNATQATAGLRPTFTASDANLNGRPSISFGPSGSANYHLAIPDNSLLDNSSEMSFFIVLRTSTNGTYGILNKRNGFAADQSYRFYRQGTNLRTDISDGASVDLAVNDNSNYILSTIYDQSVANEYSGYRNSVTSNFANVSTTLPDEASPLYIGNFNLSDNRSFPGAIAEIIIYRNALNAAERIIIENYLSQRYGIAIGTSGSNDFFSTGDATYTNDLMGIGTNDGTNKVSQSGFSDALQVTELNASLNAVNEFLLFAHDNTPHNQTNTSNLGEPEITDRWARSWFFENSGTLSTELRFDFGTAGFTIGSSSDYVLLYRPDLSSNFTRMLVNSYSIENTDQLVVDVSNTNLPTGYYTIGRGDQLVPGDVYSYQSGDWNDPLTWTTDPSGALRIPVTGLVPTSDDNVTILSGRTVTMDSDDNDGINLIVNGRLNVANTTSHDFFNILGGGTISIAGDISGNDNFPTGSASVFADSIVGGTVEIIGTAINLNQSRTFNDVVINLDNATNVAVQLADYTINGDLSIQRGILQINNNVNSTSLNTTVYGLVQIDGSGELNVGTANARHQFNFFGDLNVLGRAEFTNRTATNYNSEATNGIVDANFLNTAANQQINCNGVTNFYRVEIDKGDDQTYILDINASTASNFNLYGPANYGHGNTAQLINNDNALGLLRGTVRLNENVDVPVLNNTGNYNISEAARLWVNGGSAEKPAGTAIVPYGIIQLSGGVLNAPVNSGITTRDNGSIIVSDGVMTVNQIRTSVLGVENIGGYTQSGGEVNVTGNNIETDYYVFSLTYPGNTFTMSGGTLNVSGARTGSNTGGIFIASDAANQSVTGGTVIMEINRNDNFKVTSLAPFWNVTMRYTSGSGNQVDLITGASGNGANVTNITDVDLRVLNNLVIESGITFDHNGYDVEIGSDFIIQNGADYIYDSGKPNTTTLNGVDNSLMTFNNRTGGVSDEQRFWNLIIDKPTTATITLQSGKSDVTGNENNLLRIEGDFFKVLSGTLDQAEYSIRLYADTLVNYDVLTVFDPLVTNDSDPNGENDLLKLRDDGGPATVFITADTSRFGGIKLNSGSEIINLISDVKIDYLEYRHGRMNLDIHNLTIDRLNVILNGSETRTDEDGGGNFSVEDMFITAGNASDGGLSLYVPSNAENPGFINMSGAGNTTNNPTVFFFPLGTGTTGSDATSEYTPVNIRFLSGTDDGYVTVIPVTQKLATAGPYPLGNDIADRYWIVDYRDFTTVPKVERMWFRAVEKDDPTGGNPNSFPANYVPGYVLEDAPYTRTAEVNAGAPSSSGIDNANSTNIRIFFWGNEGSGNPAGGFDLIHAAYTAGTASKFVGAPQIFYTRLSNGSDWYNRYWQDNNNWSFVAHDGATNNSSRPAAGDYPQAGDIAVIGYGGYDGSGTIRHSININDGNTVDVARVIFENPNNNANRLVLRRNANINFDIITGTGGTFMQRFRVTDTQLITGDFGSFYNNENFIYAYYLENNGTYNLNPPTNTFPNLRIEGGSDNRVAIFQQNIFVNNDMIVDGNTTLRTNNGANGDIVVLEDLRIGGYLGGNFVFNSGNERTVEVGRLRFIGSSGTSNMTVDNTSTNGLRHRLIVNQDIIQSRPGDFDLLGGNNINDNNVIIEFAGQGNHSYSKTDGNVAEFYQIVMNKGNGLSNSFTIAEDFNLADASSTFSPLTITRGMLILDNSNIDISVLNGALDLAIPTGGGLRINQGIVRIQGDDSGILLDGSLIIAGGTLDMDDAVGNGNNFIEYSASGNAILEISAGTLDVGSQIRPITTANTGVLKYRQTGGDVRIGTQAGPTSNRGMLQIYNVGSEFNFTGGTLTIERHQTSPTISALYLDPDVSNVTGEITIFNANTPAGQSNFRINCVIALNNLTINGTNSPTAVIRTNPLTVNGTLTINSGATFNGNGLTLTVNGDFENNGTYDAQNNETIFNTDLTQEIRGSGTNNFFRVTKSGSGSLELTNAVTINGLFTISEGTINDNGFDITLNADAVIDGTHSSSGGNGLVFSGSANQELRRTSSGTSTIGGIRINNTNGVTIPDGNGYNFNINADLQLNGGVFDVGGSNILFGENSDIIAVQPFSVSNMIRTNSSFVDKGVGKTFTANTTTDFTFPLGQAYYTPVVFDLSSNSNTSGSTIGTIFVSPANEYHPTIDDGNDITAGGDINNVLQYYWTLTAEDITGFTSDVTFGYNDALVEAINGSEADYIAARILAFNNPTNLISKFTTNDVDESLNLIEFFFNGDNSNGITGDYFAGIDLAIPNNVATYVVDTDGSFASDVYDAIVPGGGAPTGSVVIIPNGFTLTLDQNDARFYRTEIQSGAVLEVDNSSNHRLGILDGTGDLRIISNGVNANLPAFSGDFLSCTGGGLEYAGTGNYNVLGGITTVRNLTFSGSGSRTIPNNNLNICEDLILNGPTVNNPNNRNVTIGSDLIINSGIYNAGQGSLVVNENLLLTGGTFDNNNGGTTSVFGNINLTGGTFNVSSGGLINTYGNITNGGATFNGGSSSARINLFGTSQQLISGNFTGSNSFHRLLINNAQGALLGSTIEVSNNLFLTNGIINTGANVLEIGVFGSFSPSIGRSNSFVDGKVTKTLSSAGSSFTFPVGDAGRWRPVLVNNVSVGGETWEAQFFAGAATNEAVVDNFNVTNPAQISTILQSEYWKISDGNVGSTGNTATIGLSWGTESDVSATFAEREQLQVLIWNDGLSSWDNLGGTNFSSGHTQATGRFRASSSNSFSERIYTLGSSDPNNPLPVELISFTGQILGSATRLEWKTSSELNNDYFEIEYSTDGLIFETWSRVEGAGTTTEIQDYVIFHERPIDGFNYYRLKQVDYDGTTSYKGIVSVYKEGKVVELNFVPFPNPTTQDNITLKVTANAGPVIVELVDVMGTSLSKTLFNSNELINQEVKLKSEVHLKQGIYIIKMTQGGKSIAKRILIKE